MIVSNYINRTASYGDNRKNYRANCSAYCRFFLMISIFFFHPNILIFFF